MSGANTFKKISGAKMDEEMKTKEDPIPRTTSAIADSDSDGESPISSKKQRKDHGRIHEVDGEEDASTSQFNDQGDQMTSFNLKEENEEGFYDGSGNYVWKKEEKSMQEDAWLDNISEVTMKAASDAKSAKVQQEELEEDNLTISAAIRILDQLLQPNEAVITALRRLGTQKKPQTKKRKQQQQKNVFATNVQSEANKDQFNAVTEAADYLLRQGEVDIYQQTKEYFQHQVAQTKPKSATYFSSHDKDNQAEEETKTGPMDTQEQYWEYKGEDGQIHGPYTRSQIIEWRQQGYFTGPTAVLMREIGHNKSKEKESIKSAEKELLDDFDDEDEEEAVEQDENSWQNSDQIRW